GRRAPSHRADGIRQNAWFPLDRIRRWRFAGVSQAAWATPRECDVARGLASSTTAIVGSECGNKHHREMAAWISAVDPRAAGLDKAGRKVLEALAILAGPA